ncbi:DUF2637 domain-containing protein [Pseudofrankia sp. BMG5.36]|uniref:DUF2637 domain-containing protein n=1 Tax=Pseudofrankia sp. BMG5.36 TaxID=1834512 RepID=UPI0008DAB73B|nr:DUF2637 domain-containing protein [Pseudofrankia sp. BMG5.36]OHV44904.1 hypothetical protein BCD48_23875 [Pseudofrankia sp. BMG5.36]
MNDRLHRLRRLQWGVRVALTLGVSASIAANVLHAQPSIVGRVMSAWSPVALLITVELISRVPVHRLVLAFVGRAATAAVAGVAAYVSYFHMVSVAARYGETAISAHLLPLSVDGLVVVASIALLETGGRIRAELDNTQPAPSPAGAVGAVLDLALDTVTAAAFTSTPDPTPTPTTERTAKRVPARTGRTQTSTPRNPDRKRAPQRTDADLIAALRDLPRAPDGTVPVRRAAAALGIGHQRATRLLDTAGLRTPAPTPTVSDVPAVPAAREPVAA